MVVRELNKIIRRNTKMDKTRLLNDVNGLIEGKDVEMKVVNLGDNGFHIQLNGYDKNSISNIYNQIISSVQDLAEELIEFDNEFTEYYFHLVRDELEPYILIDIETDKVKEMREMVDEKFIKIESKYEILTEDKPLVKLIKKTINAELDNKNEILFETFSNKDKENLERLLNRIEKNELTFKSFKRIIDLLGFKIKVTTVLDDDDELSFYETV